MAEVPLHPEDFLSGGNVGKQHIAEGIASKSVGGLQDANHFGDDGLTSEGKFERITDRDAILSCCILRQDDRIGFCQKGRQSLHALTRGSTGIVAQITAKRRFCKEIHPDQTHGLPIQVFGDDIPFHNRGRTGVAQLGAQIAVERFVYPDRGYGFDAVGSTSSDRICR